MSRRRIAGAGFFFFVVGYLWARLWDYALAYRREMRHMGEVRDGLEWSGRAVQEAMHYLTGRATRGE